MNGTWTVIRHTLQSNVPITALTRPWRAAAFFLYAITGMSAGVVVLIGTFLLMPAPSSNGPVFHDIISADIGAVVGGIAGAFLLMVLAPMGAVVGAAAGLITEYGLRRRMQQRDLAIQIAGALVGVSVGFIYARNANDLILLGVYGMAGTFIGFVLSLLAVAVNRIAGRRAKVVIEPCVEEVAVNGTDSANER